jgi:hypothetical protein
MEVDEQGDNSQDTRVEDIIVDYQGYFAKAQAIQEKFIDHAVHKNISKPVGAELRGCVAALVNIIFEQQHLIKHYAGQVQALKTAPKRPAYAEVARQKDRSRSRSRKRTQTQGLVTVYPKGEQNSVKTRQEIQKLVNPREVKVGVNAVRNIRNGGILIETESKEEGEILIKSMKENRQVADCFEIGVPKKRNPQIIIYNVTEVMEPKEMIDLIVEQNEEIEVGEIEYRAKYQIRTGGHNIIFSIDGAAFSRFARKRIRLGWVSYPFKEYFRPILCFKCGQYGHFAARCKNSEVCLKCGIEGHIRKDCTGEVCCNNCKLHNVKFKTRFEVNHQCTNRACRVYEKEIERIISRTNYG